MTDKLTRALTDDEMQKRGWSVKVNGVVVPDAREVELFNAKMGLNLNYGMRPEGYDGVYVDQPFGAVILPYTIWPQRNKLYVGVLAQERALQGGKIWNAVRGMMNPGETHFEAAQRELSEELAEAGVDAQQLNELKSLNGQAGNADSAFFNTPNTHVGVQFFAIEIPAGLLRPGDTINPDGIAPIRHSMDFTPAQVDTLQFGERLVVPKTKTAERIFACHFVPAHFAVELQDLFTVSAVARLLATKTELLPYFNFD